MPIELWDSHVAVVAVKVLLLYIPASTTTPVNNNTHLRTAPNVLT